MAEPDATDALMGQIILALRQMRRQTGVYFDLADLGKMRSMTGRTAGKGRREAIRRFKELANDKVELMPDGSATLQSQVRDKLRQL